MSGVLALSGVLDTDNENWPVGGLAKATQCAASLVGGAVVDEASRRERR